MVEVTNKPGEDGFTAADRALAATLTDQAAIAIDNARLCARLADALVTAPASYQL